MRRAYNNVRFIIDEDIFYGVSLGYDFTSEHEWGIKGMISEFGMKDGKLGIKNRMVTKGNVFFAEDDKMCVLTSRDPFRWKRDEDKPKEMTTEDLLSHDISHFRDDLETAWDENNFCVATNNKENYKYIKELYDAFQNKNIAIAFISGKIPVFENASLSLLIADRLPKEITDSMYYSDKKAEDLVKYEKKIGVTKLKEKALKNYSYKGDKYYCACSPKWIDYNDPENREKIKKELGTKYDIRFWVNYSDDDDNYGWYNAEQIIEWLSTPGVKLKSLNKEKKENDN